MACEVQVRFHIQHTAGMDKISTIFITRHRISHKVLFVHT